MKQVVINVPDEWLEGTQPNLYDVMGAVMNGTVLPEHHGDLIDRSELLKKEVWGSFGEIGDDAPCVFKADIDEAPTIIPATKEGD